MEEIGEGDGVWGLIGFEFGICDVGKGGHEVIEADEGVTGGVGRSGGGPVGNEWDAESPFVE